jgi:hypothetical protein
MMLLSIQHRRTDTKSKMDVHPRVADPSLELTRGATAEALGEELL